MKYARLLLALTFVGVTLVLLLGPGCTPTFTRESSEKIARAFVEEEATFRFDGIPETLKLESTRQVEENVTWVFIFSFQSRHGGYGDRTGQQLTQVITPHLARVTVDKGKVTMAVMDERWDMLRQRFI